MKRYLAHITLLVKDYDEAIAFYVEKLDFEVLEDTTINKSKRWVLIAPKGSTGCSLLLGKASDAEQLTHTGNQTGGRVFLFLYTDDFWRDYKRMLSMQIEVVRQPAEEAYGIVAVFKDLYGNLWDLIQPPDPIREA